MFILHQVLPSISAKNALLIVASLVFYAYGEPVYVVLMIASTLVNWGFGILLEHTASERLRKGAVALAVVSNLAFLGVFKYASMAVSSLNAITGLELPMADIALPIGISFYTFQAMSYVIDVYREKAAANAGR